MIFNNQEEKTWTFTTVLTDTDENIKIDCCSLLGKRDNQEDALGWGHTKDGSLFFLMCDGLGGHASGEKASEEAVSFLASKFKEWDITDPSHLETELLAFLEEAKNKLRRYGDRRDTTLVVGILTDSYIYLYSIGDSLAEVVFSDQRIPTPIQGVGNRVYNTLAYFTPSVLLTIPKGKDFKIILATDGIESRFSNWELTESALSLCEEACKEGSDNASCIIISISSTINTVDSTEGEVECIGDISQPEQ